MKSSMKTEENTQKNQNLKNLQQEVGDGWNEDMKRMKALTNKAEDEMGWKVTLTYPHLYWIYRVEGEIIGFIKKIPMKRELGLIHFLYVHPDHRSKGYGSDMVEQFSQRFDSVWVEIRNEEIKDFYRKLEPQFRSVKVGTGPSIKEKNELL